MSDSLLIVSNLLDALDPYSLLSPLKWDIERRNSKRFFQVTAEVETRLPVVKS